MDRADLHLHTTASDGDFAPAEVIRRAAAAGLSAVAVTDHNTVAGVGEALTAGEARGVRVIPGVEISAAHGDGEVHLLGYFVDWQAPGFGERLARAERDFAQALLGRAARMRSLGFWVEDEDVLEFRPEGGYILKSLLEALLRGDRDRADRRLDPYRAADLPARLAFFRDYQGPSAPGYVSTAVMPIGEAIDLVRGVGGVPVLAHPVVSLGLGKPASALEPLLRELAGRGLAGVEVFSSYHSASVSRGLRRLARRLGLGVTAGSDFHGPSLKPGLEVGQVAGDCREVLDWMEQATGSSSRAPG
ncbi:MAG: PHP domain-containing protein [bacterium]|nr:PHP domain-containing protein [bacterium]